MATTLAPFTVSPVSTDRSLTTAVRRVAEIGTDDNEYAMPADAVFPPGKAKRYPGGRVGSSSCACTITGSKKNASVINKPDKIDFNSATGGNLLTHIWRKLPVKLTEKLGVYINNRL